MIQQYTKFTCELCGKYKYSSMEFCNTSHETPTRDHFINASQPIGWQQIKLNGEKLVCDSCSVVLTEAVKELRIE